MSIEIDPYEKSIMLLVLTENIIKDRRMIEKACGYPDEYGKDHLLIRAITNHLSDPRVKPTVARVKKLIELKSGTPKV